MKAEDVIKLANECRHAATDSEARTKGVALAIVLTDGIDTGTLILYDKVEGYDESKRVRRSRVLYANTFCAYADCPDSDNAMPIGDTVAFIGLIRKGSPPYHPDCAIKKVKGM